jgi:SAM-dependent methyltransferase
MSWARSSTYAGAAQRGRLALRRFGPARAARTASLATLDALDGVLGRREELRPPRRLQSVGSGDFHEVGAQMVHYLRELGGLRPDARVLDVGCGTGRLAVALTGYLTGGSYRGFDIVPSAVRWCQGEITPRYPSFKFDLAQIANSHYNPEGDLQAAAFRFPYDDASFDFVCATSVFTHMLPAEFLNYMSEIARVLAPRGSLLGTFFLLNHASIEALESRRGGLPLPYELKDSSCGVAYRAADAHSPEAALGLPEEAVREAFERSGMELGPVRYGSWSGRADGFSYQDILVAERS